jgi:hypothetical protein
MPRALLRTASKQLQQGFQAVKLRVGVNRSRSFDGLPAGSGPLYASSPRMTAAASPGTLSGQPSILEDSAFSLPPVAETGSHEVEDFREHQTVSLQCSTETDDAPQSPVNSTSHRLQHIMHKISSFGSSSAATGDSEESSSFSGIFRHRRMKSESSAFNFMPLVRKRSDHQGSDGDSSSQRSNLHLAFFGRHRSDMTSESEGDRQGDADDHQHHHPLNRIFGRLRSDVSSEDDAVTLGDGEDPQHHPFSKLFSRRSTGDEDSSHLGNSNNTGLGLSSLVARGLQLHPLKRRHSES